MTLSEMYTPNEMYPKSKHPLRFGFCMFMLLWAKVLGRLNAGDKNNQDSEQSDLSHLRYLAFGTSKTWGAGLEKRSDAFPHLLSREATNLALRASGPEYPNMCTQSMVGDGIYDVITLEYFEVADQGAKQLAQRLRERFPNAVIIFLQLWHPLMIHYTGDGVHTSVGGWIRENGFVHQGVVDRSKLIKALEEKSSEDFHFDPQATRYRLNTIESAAKAVNGYILKGPPFPDATYENTNVKKMMLSTIDHFGKDWFHPSEEGHRMMAQAVKDLLYKIPVKRSDEVGTWGKRDKCFNWYENGKVDIPYSEKIINRQFFEDKHALEFPSTGGTMRISNPFEVPQSLTLTYMATGPNTSIYPKAKVHIDNSTSEDITIDPLVTDYDFPVHITLSTNVGIVTPGENIVSMMPLETSEQPFRLVAAALTNGDEQVLK